MNTKIMSTENIKNKKNYPNFTLSAKEIDAFNQHGVIGPFAAFTIEEMKLIYRELLENINIIKLFTDKQYRLYNKRNRHLDLPLISKICSHPAIVERVANILGSDLVLWRSNLFFSLRGKGIPWHQDQYHTLLSDTDNHISVHLAINQATFSNCLSVLLGSHKMSREELQNHYGLRMLKDTDSSGYGVPLYTSQKLAFETWENSEKMLLKPGEFFIFHPRIVHTSQSNSWPRYQQIANRAKWFLAASAVSIGQIPPPEWVRVGLGIRITVPSVKVFSAAFTETQTRNDKCILIRGVDGFGINGDMQSAWLSSDYGYK